MNSKLKAFSTVELVGAILVFGGITSGIFLLQGSMRNHWMASVSANAQNAYATFQSQVALQGIDPTHVANPLGNAINQGSGAQHLNALFESNSVTRDLAGSVRVKALSYNVLAAGNEPARGAGIGYVIETSGSAAPGAPNPMPLLPPTFNVSGDLKGTPFPWNDITNCKQLANPAGTIYRYTTDGSAPTGASPIWNNDPGWTPDTFPAKVAIAAFNPDPQYQESSVAQASFTMTLTIFYNRADNRANCYDVTLGDYVAGADATGVVLSASIDSAVIYYTIDGSDPTTSPSLSVYNGPFLPPQSSQYWPNPMLQAVAVSTDPRFSSSSVWNHNLNAVSTPLAAPSFVTPNDQPLAPGSVVAISVTGGNGSPRTEVNNGVPTTSSSQATSFPLN